MPRKRDKRKLDTRLKRVKLRRAEAELSVYRKTHAAVPERVETDPEILRLKASSAEADLLYRRQLHYNSLCRDLLFLDHGVEEGKDLAAKVAVKYGHEVIGSLQTIIMPVLGHDDTT